MSQTTLAPAPRRRVFVAVGLGVALLVGSLAYAGLALRSHAGDGAGNAAPGPGGRRAVALAFVDIEGGVTPLYVVQPGRVVEVLAEEGKEYEAGAPLFRVDDTLAKADEDRARLDLEGAKEKLAEAKRLVGQHEKTVEAHRAAIEVLKHDAEAARAQQAKAERLRKTVGSPEDVDAAKAQVKKADAAVRAAQKRLEAFELTDPSAGVRAAEIDVKAKRRQLEEAEYGVKQCTVTAPTKGTVLRNNITVGYVLGPNPQQPAILFARSGPRIVRAEVEQEFAGRVFKGQPARIEDDATGGGDWRGKVVRVSDWYSQRRSILLEPLQFNDVRTLEVILRFDPEPKAPPRIGQRVRVMLEGAE